MWFDGHPGEDSRTREGREKARQLKTGRVYFLGGEGTPVKIGFSNSPATRLRDIQICHWATLSILASEPGTEADEKAYHVRFADFRIRGEWFERVPEIEAEIDRLRASPTLSADIAKRDEV